MAIGATSSHKFPCRCIGRTCMNGQQGHSRMFGPAVTSMCSKLKTEQEITVAEKGHSILPISAFPSFQSEYFQSEHFQNDHFQSEHFQFENFHFHFHFQSILTRGDGTHSLALSSSFLTQKVNIRDTLLTRLCKMLQLAVDICAAAFCLVSFPNHRLYALCGNEKWYLLSLHPL